jgi:hypothetical protein
MDPFTNPREWGRFSSIILVLLGRETPRHRVPAGFLNLRDFYKLRQR